MIGFILFAVVASFTPGPTNILVMASAARLGLVATVPLILGAAFAVSGMIWAAGLGLVAPIASYPLIRHALTTIGFVWLGRLAWQLFRSAGDPVTAANAQPARPGALAGAGLQLVNPKAWMMALAVVGVFAPGDAGAAGATLRAVVFLIVAVTGLSSWSALGRYGIGWLGSGRQRRLFNRAMALLLIVAAGASLWI